MLCSRTPSEDFTLRPIDEIGTCRVKHKKELDQKAMNGRHLLKFKWKVHLAQTCRNKRNTSRALELSSSCAAEFADSTETDANECQSKKLRFSGLIKILKLEA